MMRINHDSLSPTQARRWYIKSMLILLISSDNVTFHFKFDKKKKKNRNKIPTFVCDGIVFVNRSAFLKKFPFIKFYENFLKHWSHLPRVLNMTGLLRNLRPALNAVTVTWYCVFGIKLPSVTESELTAISATTL